MKRLLALAAVLLLSAGCAGVPTARAGIRTPSDIPGVWRTTPAGVHVFLPQWLLISDKVDQALREIATTVPDSDPRIPAGKVGVPAGVYVIIRDPGSYSAPGSPTGLARGHTDMATYIVVAWRMRPWETEPLLPALGHELRHFYTGDGEAGH